MLVSHSHCLTLTNPFFVHPFLSYPPPARSPIQHATAAPPYLNGMERGLISVDRWAEGSQTYFLTHLHSDHTQGLSSSWSRGLLFCSRLTAKLLPIKFPNFKLSLLRVLDIGVWHSLSLRSPYSDSTVSFEVMPIDANHCPGAVMFLFRGEFGCVLYTGDFRWETICNRSNQSKSMIVEALKDTEVDIVYMDNTYCNPLYAFPPRKVASQQVVDLIASHPEHDIIIAIDNLGKEDLLLYISRMLKIKIWVWPERLETLHLLGYHDTFTTNTCFTRVRAVPRYSFTIDTLNGLNAVRPTIGIMPSGLPWMIKSREQGKTSLQSSCSNAFKRTDSRQKDGQNWSMLSVEKFHEHIYSVPYSDHSSYHEIQEFIEVIQPINLRGIVSSSSSCNIDPLYYFGRSQGLNRPSNKSFKEADATMIGVKIKSSLLKSDPSASRRKRKRSVNIGVYGNLFGRVSVLRRIQCGVKLRDEDCELDVTI